MHPDNQREAFEADAVNITGLYDSGALKLLRKTTGKYTIAVEEQFRVFSLGFNAGQAALASAPAVEAPREVVEIGDYVVATKYSDGDFADPWAVGFYAGEKNGRHEVNDSEGKPIRASGYAKVKTASKDFGEWLLANSVSLERTSPSPEIFNIWKLVGAWTEDAALQPSATQPDNVVGAAKHDIAFADGFRAGWNAGIDEDNEHLSRINTMRKAAKAAIAAIQLTKTAENVSKTDVSNADESAVEAFEWILRERAAEPDDVDFWEAANKIKAALAAMPNHVGDPNKMVAEAKAEGRKEGIEAAVEKSLRCSHRKDDMGFIIANYIRNLPEPITKE